MEYSKWNSHELKGENSLLEEFFKKKKERKEHIISSELTKEIYNTKGQNMFHNPQLHWLSQSAGLNKGLPAVKSSSSSVGQAATD